MDAANAAAEQPPRWSDFYLVLYFALAFPLGRLILDACLFQRICRWLHIQKRGGATALSKATESMWKLSYTLSAEVFGLYAIWQEPWLKNTAAFWDGWPNHTIKSQLKLFYTFQCGFYVYSVAALLVWDTRRKDFNVMMSHHLVSIALVAGSFISGFFRVGSVILILHDASDVLLEAAKLLKYSRKETGASITFGMFAISWIVLRLGFFPLRILRSTSYESSMYLDLHYLKAVYYWANMLLVSLLVLHIYWWVLICRMVIKQLKNNGKVGDDVRSDNEEEDI